MTIFVIDDDEIMAECIARACQNVGDVVECDVRIFADAISAMGAITDGVMPDLILLDVMLDGPDGFTFLNELISYDDTAKVPVVIVSSLDVKGNLDAYGVVQVLSKDTMMPQDIKNYVLRYGCECKK